MGLAEPESNDRSERTEALYREHGDAVAAFCRSRLRDRGEAEDAMQQVFLSAHRALLNGTVPREPLAWLLAVARHECYARFRQRATTPLPAGDAPEGVAADASVHVLRAGELASMWDEIGQMPPTQRDAFLLREIRGLSYGQLASELSLSPPSVRSLLLRARTRLRSRLGDVAAGLGGAQWVQALLRLFGGGDGAAPMPAATKALAVGVGALALAGGGDVPRLAHHAAAAAARPASHRRPAAHVRRAAAAPIVVATVRREDQPRPEERSRGGDGSHRSGSDRSGRHKSGDDSSVAQSAGGPSHSSGDDGGGAASATTTVVQPTSDGGDKSSGSGSGSGSDSGSDGGPGPSSTTSLSSSDGGPDGSTSSGHDGSGSGSGSDG